MTPAIIHASSDSTAWWPADWSQFLPDLINTAVVGALVGLALWGMQSVAANRERRLLAERVWAHTRPLILNAASAPWERTPYIAFWEDNVNRVLDAAKNVDIVTISTALPENQEAKALSMLMRDAPTLKRAAQDFSKAVAAAMNRHPGIGSGVGREAVRTRVAADALGVEAPLLYYTGVSLEGWVLAVISDTAAERAQYLRVLEGIEQSYQALKAHPAAHSDTPAGIGSRRGIRGLLAKLRR